LGTSGEYRSEEEVVTAGLQVLRELKRRQAGADLDGVWDYLAIEKNSPAAARRQIEMLYKRF